MTEMLFGLNWTGLDQFFAVKSGFFGSCHNRQPVSVAVHPSKAKKPDWTGPADTRWAQSGCSGLKKMQQRTLYATRHAL